MKGELFFYFERYMIGVATELRLPAPATVLRAKRRLSVRQAPLNKLYYLRM